MLFLGYDIYYMRTAETALTSSHTRTHAAFDSVYCVARKASSHGVENFAFADFFAAADDNAVIRVCCYELFAVFVGHFLRLYNSLADRVEVFIWLNGHLL